MSELNEIRFIDLFSGIGGFRLGLKRTNQVRTLAQQRNGIETGQPESLFEGGRRWQFPQFRCVWSCDNNKYTNQVYSNRFGEAHHYTDDIRGINPAEIPDFDLLCAGFPCQAFSVAGKRKGFQDTRGTLFFEICRVAEAKRPSLLLLENVKGLLNHDGGRTFTIILQALDELGYWVEWQVLNSKHFGVPQNRERVFIVGHLRGKGGREIFPIGEIGEHSIGTQEKTRGKGTRLRNEHNSTSRSLRVGGSGREDNLIAQTISARYHKDGAENLIQVGVLGKDSQANRIYSPEGLSPTMPTSGGGRHEPKIAIPVLTPDRPEKRQHGRRFKEDGESAFTMTGQDKHGVYDGYKIRRLTPLECERLQGFPDGWTDGISDTQRYKCLGNAVTVNVIEFLGRKLRSSLSRVS